MPDQIKSEFKFNQIFTIISIIAFIVAWSTLYLNTMFDVDIGWLLQCLERFLAGGTYTQDFYETNPPLSFLIYYPSYLIYHYTPIAPHIAILINFIGYIAISNIVLYKMLKIAKITQFNIITIISACLITQSWAAGISYASKDHLIFIFLLPLCMLQYLITINKNPPKHIIILSIIMGGIAICLKPYYGIIPAAFFAHRLFTTKSLLKCIISYDFIGLLLIGLSYIGFIYLFTPEYIELLPQVAKIYSSTEPPFPITTRLTYLIFLFPAIMLAFFIPRNKNNMQIRYFIFTCVFICLLSVIPYYLQFKGYNYHALPFLSFAILALFLSITAISKEIFKYNDYAILISCFIISFMTHIFTTGGEYKNLSNNQFMATPLIESINDLSWNRVYANYNWNTMFTPLPYISDLKLGSRFGQIWMLRGLYEIYSHTNDKSEKEILMQKMIDHVDLIAEDMVRYKPSVITIPQYLDPNTNKPSKAFTNFLLKNKKFKDNMDNYIFKKSIKFNNSLTANNYDPEKMELHDLYVLKKDNKL